MGRSCIDVHTFVSHPIRSQYSGNLSATRVPLGHGYKIVWVAIVPREGQSLRFQDQYAISAVQVRQWCACALNMSYAFGDEADDDPDGEFEDNSFIWSSDADASDIDLESEFESSGSDDELEREGVRSHSGSGGNHVRIYVVTLMLHVIYRYGICLISISSNLIAWRRNMQPLF